MHLARCTTCGIDLPAQETRPDHWSWIEFTPGKMLPVCRHLSYPEFRRLMARFKPGWKIERVARKASPRHYLNVMLAYAQAQTPVVMNEVAQAVLRARGES